MAIKVSITDDHPLAISGLQNMLGSQQDIIVEGTYETGAALLEGLKQNQPDVLLLDVLLPDYKGQDLAETVSKLYPDIKIMAITSLDAPLYVKSMMRHGCRGYILKNTRLKPLVHAIQQVYQGETYIEPSLREQMMQHMLQLKKSPASRSPTLTQREKEILKLIVAEYSNQEIADKLYISLRTVENHRFSLLQKLEVKNAVGLVKAALQLGLAE